VRWKGYSPTHDQWVDKSDITAEELVTIYKRENREECPPQRSIRTPRKKANEVICSLRLSPISQHYYRPMSSNANTVQQQQMQPINNGNPAAKVQSPQVAFPPVTPIKDSPTVVDATVFTGTSSTGPIQVRDGTPRLSFVPIGGAFIDTNTITSLQGQPVAYLTAIKDGEDNAPLPLTLSPVPLCSEKSALPSPLSIPLRPQTDNHSGASSAHDSVLTSADPDRDCYSHETLLTLWKWVKALGWYHTEHGQCYPGGFSLPGLSKTAVMIRELNAVPNPPENLADFMMEQDIRHRLDWKLAEGLRAVLPQLAEYVIMDDSQDVLKEQTHETRHMAKELRDDSQHVLKDLAPRTIEWGNNIMVVPIGSRPALQHSGPSPRQGTPCSMAPALEALGQARSIRQLLEEGEDSSDDDIIDAVKMEVNLPPKISSRGNAEAPIDLTTSDNDSNKENKRNHPGPTWMCYDRTNAEHYHIDIPKDGMTSATLFICYVFDSEEMIVEGCNGKHSPIYRKALYTCSADTCPNLHNDKLIRDDHLHVFHPQASLKELVDRHIHTINDPGVTAEVVRFRSQTSRHATFSACLKSLEEDIRMNDDALFETKRCLIHARLPTRIFNNIYSEPPTSPPVHCRHMPTVRGAQGPPDEDDVPFHHPYKRPTPRQPAFCYECFELQPDHQVRDCPSYG